MDRQTEQSETETDGQTHRQTNRQTEGGTVTQMEKNNILLSLLLYIHDSIPTSYTYYVRGWKYQVSNAYGESLISTRKGRGLIKPAGIAVDSVGKYQNSRTEYCLLS